MISRPRVSIVIPTHNGAATLADCLQSLRLLSLPPHEIIVVDDASSDSSAEIAHRYGCTVARADRPIGAAQAKNCGARSATGEVLFFTDDDVVVAPDSLAWVAEDLARDGVAGVVGLLDRKIPFEDFSSNYKNLWMRFTYARLPRERIGVFYTSVAAIRRDLFLRLGGFDENFTGASIGEDTEFGQRAWTAGCRLIVDDRIVVRHSKRYTPAQVLRTDFQRARALTLMRLRKWGRPFFTSVPAFYQFAVPTLFAGILCLVLGALFLNAIPLLLGVVLLGTFYGLNLPWLLFLANERGLSFALRAALMQPVDAAAVGAGMVTALFEYARGTKY